MWVISQSVGGYHSFSSFSRCIDTLNGVLNFRVSQRKLSTTKKSKIMHSTLRKHSVDISFYYNCTRHLLLYQKYFCPIYVSISTYFNKLGLGEKSEAHVITSWLIPYTVLGHLWSLSPNLPAHMQCENPTTNLRNPWSGGQHIFLEVDFNQFSRFESLLLLFLLVGWS